MFAVRPLVVGLVAAGCWRGTRFETMSSAYYRMAARVCECKDAACAIAAESEWDDYGSTVDKSDLSDDQERDLITLGVKFFLCADEIRKTNAPLGQD